MLRLTALTLLPFAVYGARVQECPTYGAVHPPNFDMSKSDAIASAIEAFPGEVERLFTDNVLNKTNLAFGIDVFSTTTNTSLYSYYHTGDSLKGALLTGEFNESTVSRIGSVSKLFTVYALLSQVGLEIFDDPVTKYVPELKGNADKDPLKYVHWEDVTIRAIISQQAGTGGPSMEMVTCYDEPEGCSIDTALKQLRDARSPTTLPFQTPLYSDAGFIVLGRVLEAIQGKPYDEALKETLGPLLDFEYTSTYEPPNGTNGIALPGTAGDSSWGVDNQLTAPSGGIYTTGNDLRSLGLSILNSEVLPSKDTRRWMKAAGATESLNVLVGAPWEIIRLNMPVSPNSDRTRVSDLFTKLGGNSGYGAVMALSPEHGIGFSVMTVGPLAAVDRLHIRNVVGDVFLPAAEHAAFANAQANLAGTFVEESGKDGTNLTLTVDEGSPGLGLKALFLDGADSLGIVKLIPFPPQIKFTIRMYPTGNTSPPDMLYATGGSVKLSYRAQRDVLPFRNHEVPSIGRGMFNNECMSWIDVGFLGNEDEFILELEDGRLEAVTHSLSGYRMVRQ